jgi:DNA polymerase-1
LIVDSHALLHRAYHALPPLVNSKGEPIGAIYGFASILVSAIAQIKPNYLVACFDLPKPTIRHKKFADYKAKRPKTPDDLIKQFTLVRRFLKNLEIPIMEKEGYEADDAIGTIIEIMSKKYKNIENIVVTGDLDTLQLINKQTKILTPRRGVSDPTIYDEKKLKERFPGLSPNQVIEYKGLRGDSSDNIPGVPGIGEKRAINLINKFGTIDKIYENLENEKEAERFLEEKILSPSILKKLKENKDLAFFSRELATIYRDIPIKFNLKDAAWEPNPIKVENALLDFGLRSLVRRYQAISKGRELLPSSHKTVAKQGSPLRKSVLPLSRTSKNMPKKKKPIRQSSLF